MDEFMRRLALNGIKTRVTPTHTIATLVSKESKLSEPAVKTHEIVIHNEGTLGSGLLNLPGEIRTVIWELVLISRTGFIKPLRSGHRDRKNCRSKLDFHCYNARKSVSNDLRFETPGEHILLSLLFTNKQVNSETEFVFWEKNAFVLHPSDICMSPNLLAENGLSKSFLHKVRHVDFPMDLRRGYFFTDAYPNRTFEIAWTILAAMATTGNLTDMTVVPLAGMEHYQDMIDLMRRNLTYRMRLLSITSLCYETHHRGILDHVKINTEVELDWNKFTEREGHNKVTVWREEKEALARLFLARVSQCVSGGQGKLCVDGESCFDQCADGKRGKRKAPFWETEEEKNERERAEIS